MTGLRQYLDLTAMHLRMYRAELVFMVMIQVVLSLGLILGFGYFIPGISRNQAIFITTGAAINAMVTIGLVGLPQSLALAKAEGRLEYFLTLPLSREAYVFSQVTYAAIVGLPSAFFALLFGAWHYGFGLHPDPALLLVVPLAVLSLAGLGVLMAILSPHQQLTAALTQLIIFYVLLFAPIMLAKSQLPVLLQHTAVFMPPTYVADAVRGTVAGLSGSHVARSLWLMAGFAAASLALASAAVRRRS